MNRKDTKYKLDTFLFELFDGVFVVFGGSSTETKEF